MKKYILSALILLLLTSCSSSRKTGIYSNDFTAQNENRRQVSLSDFQGKPVLMTFWASWCTSCTAELPMFETIWRRYRSSGLIILGVAVEDDFTSALAKVKRSGVTFPIMVDVTNQAKSTFGVGWLPTTVLLDRAGLVVPLIDPDTGEESLSVNGPRSWSNRTFDTFLRERLEAGL